MILCPGPNDKLWISTDTSAVHAHVSGLDVDATGKVTTYRKNTAAAGASSVDITAPAASGVTRNVKNINLRNTGASTGITVRHYDGTVSVDLISIPVGVNQTLSYVEGQGWSVI